MYVVEEWLFLMLNTDFVGSPNTINIRLILSTIYIFIPVSGCVSKRSSALLCPMTYNAVDSVFFVLHPDAYLHQ